jgi:uncharacterized membrane protein
VLTNQGKLDFFYGVETRIEGIVTRRRVCGANLIAIIVCKLFIFRLAMVSAVLRPGQISCAS